MTSRPIAAIQTGERDRRDLGDIDGLAASIAAVGMLHPIVVTADGTLIAGGRRLAAAQSLGWTEVPVTVVDLSTVAQVLRAEADENTCRKSVTPYEASLARERRARVLAEDAKRRQGTRTDLQPSPKLGGSSESRTTKIAAIGTGYSGSTLDKVDAIRAVAERGETKSGEPVPEQVRQVAQESLEQIKRSGAAIEPAHAAVQATLDDYLDRSTDLLRLKRLKAVQNEISRTVNGLPSFAPTEVSEIADPDLWSDLSMCQQVINSWFNAVDRNRPQGLRLIEGSA